jgi:hypothetical protein
MQFQEVSYIECAVSRQKILTMLSVFKIVTEICL